MIVDGDHNYFTVARGAARDRPQGRARAHSRSSSCTTSAGRWGAATATTTPTGSRRSVAGSFADQGFLVPGDPGLAERGLYYERIATRGGWASATASSPRSRTSSPTARTCASRSRRRSSGSACSGTSAAAWAARLARRVAPWDRNPLLERMETKRVFHLVAEFENLQRVDALRTADYVHRYRLIGRLLPLLGSRAFALAERISAVRQSGAPECLPRRPRGAGGRPRRRRHRRRADEDQPGALTPRLRRPGGRAPGARLAPPGRRRRAPRTWLARPPDPGAEPAHRLGPGPARAAPGLEQLAAGVVSLQLGGAHAKPIRGGLRLGAQRAPPPVAVASSPIPS